MLKQRRRSFVLIEVVIAITLFALLMTVLFGIFSRYVSTDDALNKARARYEKLVLANTKLQRAFLKSLHSIPDHHYFYLDDANNLVFTYDNDIENHEQYPAGVLAKLYIDDKNNLSLAIWQHTNEKQEQCPDRFRKDIILENVSSVEYTFFKAPMEQKVKNTRTKTEEAPDVPQGRWVETWPRNLKVAPTLVKITLQPDNNTFWFILPKEVKPAIYDTR